jgi:hypothetical protein
MKEGPNIHTLNLSSVTETGLGTYKQTTEYRNQMERSVIHPQTDTYSNHGIPATMATKCDSVTVKPLYLYASNFLYLINLPVDVI